MNSYTTFKVIKIIDQYSIVINGGLNDDVSIGDKIEIYLEGDEITDPFNNNEVLGTLDFIKDTLEVTEVYSKFSVCKKITIKKIHHPSAFQQALSQNVLSSLSGFAGTTETKILEEKLTIEESEVSGRKTGEKVLKIGDIARIAITD